MSELKLLEFRERAVDAVEIPDFGVIERRGRARRRRTYATAAGTLALVLAAGAGVVSALGGDDADTAPPATQSTPSIDPGVRTRVDHGEAVLRTGPSVAHLDGFDVRFDVPGPGWEWWDSGMGKRMSTTVDDYTAAIFFLADPVARQHPCADKKVRSLGTDPDRRVANVEPLLHLAGARVLEPPRVEGVVGGGSAVHLKLETTGLCPDLADLVPQLGGTHAGAPFSPGFGGRAPIDLWHILLPGTKSGSVLVATWDLGASAEDRAELRELMSTIRIDTD